MIGAKQARLVLCYSRKPVWGSIRRPGCLPTFSSTATAKNLVPGLGFPLEDPEEEAKKKKSNGQGRGSEILLKCLETAGIMVASISMLGLAGLAYHRYYQERALNKMADAFKAGDPVFQLAMHNRTEAKKEDDEDSGWYGGYAR
jgi:hypothetical protein